MFLVGVVTVMLCLFFLSFIGLWTLQCRLLRMTESGRLARIVLA